MKCTYAQSLKTNRLRHSLFPETLAAPGFYGIEVQKWQAVGIQFSIKIPTTKYLEEYSSGERADRRRWRMKEGERVAAVKIWRSEQRATNFGHRNRIEEATPIRWLSCKMLFWQFNIFYGEVLKWSKRRDSKTNRLRHTLFPEPLAASGFYGIGAQRWQAVGIQFSIKIPTTEYLEEYSSGRRGVTRNLVGR